MKYPQLVSMPSAVQDWLDEQLEARGIDAVVYTRYILSLLQRDTLDLPDDFLSVSSNKEVGRRGRKRGRNREEYWDVWDCEQLKRSAAVECLMSASDQKCGIEKLVDELCAKLKEIQSEGEKSAHSEFPSEAVPSKQSHIPSPQDQVQKYYAAFPPLNSKFGDSSSGIITLIPEPGSAWNSKKVLANSFGKNKPCYTSLQETSSSEEKLFVGTSGWGEENKENRSENNSSWKAFGRESMKCGNQMKENAKGNKEAVFGFVWNMAGEWNGSYTDVYPGGGCGNSGSDLLKIFHCNRQNKGSKAGEDVMSEKELQAHRESNNENGVCRRLYERQTGEGNFVFPGSVDSKKEELQSGCTAHDDDDDTACSTSPGQSTEDQNLAQLIAKFDHSIEALWDPDEAASPCNFSSEETLDCNRDLPLDFQQLLSSPEKQYLSVELNNLNSKRSQNVFPTNNSFIQCGTNITSSIWSDQPSMDNSIEQDDFGMDYSQYEHQNTSDHFGDSEVKLADVCYDEVEPMADKYMLLVAGEGKIVGNKFHSEEQLQPNKCEEKDHYNSLFKNSDILEIGTWCDVPISEEKSKVTWNKYDNCSSFFTSLPWAVNCSVDDITQGVQSEKQSGVTSLGTRGTYSHFGSIFPNDYGNMNNLIQSHTDVLSDSLITLNHNREDSSFTEVIPKQNSFCGLLACRLDSGTVQEKKESVSAEQVCHSDTKDVGGAKGGKLDVEREEEDLLTSTRTHFRPIHMESIDSHLSVNAGNSNNVGCYADGTTFVIPTSLEEVVFKRSESGTLYLEAEADAGLQTPNKYMEYKEKEPYGRRHRYEELSQSVNNSREFIPKFRVRQNEKWCQTEEEDDVLQSDEVNTKRIRQGNNSAKDPEDFYFPDDDHFAEKIINSLEDKCENTAEIENKKSFSACHLEKDIYMSHNLSVLEHNSCLQHKSKIISSLGSVSSIGVAPKIPNNASCKCSSNSYHLQMWKTAWPKSSQEPGQRVWESTESGGPKSWYSIWKMSPGPLGHLCQCDIFPPMGVVVPQSLLGKESDCGGTDTRSLQYSRLREELTMEGEQLLSDLSYMQHLYQGSEWQDDAAETGESVPDWRPEEEETDGDQKLRYLSPAEDSTQEMMMYAEDAECNYIVPACQSLVKQRKSVDDLSTSHSAITSPKTALLSTDLEEEWKQNERPLNAMAIQKDRKRRHSASQRACSYYLEGSCRRPHCRFSHDLATVPCRFWADSSCLKGIACPFLHGSAQALRPVTL